MQLKQLVSILLDNAIRHSSGKEIQLELNPELNQPLTAMDADFSAMG